MRLDLGVCAFARAFRAARFFCHMRLCDRRRLLLLESCIFCCHPGVKCNSFQFSGVLVTSPTQTSPNRTRGPRGGFDRWCGLSPDGSPQPQPRWRKPKQKFAKRCTARYSYSLKYCHQGALGNTVRCPPEINLF